MSGSFSSLTLALLSASAAACATKDDAPPAPAPVVVVDAGVDGITQIKTFDPAGGMHLDDDGETLPSTVIGAGSAPASKSKRPSHPIDVILRTTPPGARAAVDGVFVGVTPTYWPGEADGREHEFTFVLAKHESGRYRFVPLVSGVVHAKLDPVSDDASTANLEPVLSPVLTPAPVVVDAGVPRPPVIAPPPTVLTPDAAPVVVPPPDAAPAPTVAAPADAASGERVVPF